MMLQQLFGSQLALPIRLAIAVIVIGALLAVTVLVMRRLTNRGRSPVRSGRPGPRLAVLDSVAVDQRRRLVLVRRDEVEHLLLVGGSSDIVVEHQIAAADEDAGVAASPAPALVASREAPALQRAAGRRGIQPPAAAPATAALAAEPVAPTLPAPEPAPAVAVAPPAPAVAPAPAAAREDRRPLPSRRPLLRTDSPAAASRPALRAAAEAPSIAPPAPAPYAPRPVQPPLTTEAAEAEAVRLAPVEPRKAPEIELAPSARIEPAPMARPEPARAEAPAPAIAPRLDDLSQRLDAALAQPVPAAPAAEPQLSLADLLGESAETPAEPVTAPKGDPRADHRSEPAPEPAAQPEPAVDSPQVRPSDRPLSRFLYQSRSRSEPRVGDEVRPRLDALPRVERPSEDGARPAAPARSEPPLRPREFAFRPVEANPREPATREAPTLDIPRREPPALREITREPLRPSEPAVVLPRPQVPVDAKAEVKSEVKTDEDVVARAGFIPAVTPKAADPTPTDAPVTTPEPKGKDPLDDFDAEMANLLGRSNARGH